MTAQPNFRWQSHIGLDRSSYPTLYLAREDVLPTSPQAHVLRHAFDVLELDGIFCAENAPIVYFKQVENFDVEQILTIHLQFWNHGGAPILVLLSPDRAEIYSGMSRPVRAADAGASLPSLITVLDHLSLAIPQFLLSVESGEFFRRYARSFDANLRVDRDLLANLGDVREILSESGTDRIPVDVIDALLCRLVFTCYLFDRGVVGQRYLNSLGLGAAQHLRDVLSMRPLAEAKAGLFKIFYQLCADFNGDLFSDDLAAEARLITYQHIEILDRFFRGTQVRAGQQSFWPYDFRFIPIEAISAIYEHFLKAQDQEDGAFYTPRFLAEIVLDSALKGFDTLLDKRFLDPACGSGIFLVGLFNRIAEEWKEANPTARNDRRARELIRILQENLFGVDINRTACRITAFSLYLAYLDQLSPRDIQGLQEKGRALPRLIAEATPFASPTSESSEPAGVPSATIRCADFFEDHPFASDVDLIVGNPPWGSTAGKKTAAGRWCARHHKPLPDKQIAAAFVWKAAQHIAEAGRISLLLPHGVLFNHSPTAVRFQRKWVMEHSLERVLNLADLRLFLFSEAIHPAVVVSYRRPASDPRSDEIEYLAPKADWTVIQAEVISILPMDRRLIRVDQLLRDLNGPDAPQFWSQSFWGSPRDLRLIDRLLLYPRLRDLVRLPSEKDGKKRWVRAEGFQPAGKNDDPALVKTLKLPSRRFIHATHPSIDLFTIEDDCIHLPDADVQIRGRSNTNTDVFRAPHVLITKGFQRIAFADLDVSFRHALRGIHGPKEDRSLLIFLAAYLRTPLAKFLTFHTSSNWGVYRPEVHVQEILRLPMPLPNDHRDPRRAKIIVGEVAAVVDAAIASAGENFLARSNLVAAATRAIEPLIYEYFEIQPLEKLLIEDTLNIIVPSIQPTRARMPVPTISQISDVELTAYKDRLCEMLNQWSKAGGNRVRGATVRSTSLGIALTVIEQTRSSDIVAEPLQPDGDLIHALDRLRKALPGAKRTFDLIRGLMIFDQNRLYIVKLIGRRFWTQSCALNDADEIAGTLLLYPLRTDQ